MKFYLRRNVIYKYIDICNILGNILNYVIVNIIVRDWFFKESICICLENFIVWLMDKIIEFLLFYSILKNKMKNVLFYCFGIC